MQINRPVRVSISATDRWQKNYDMLRAYALEPGCSVNDGLSKIKKQLQTRSIGCHVASKNTEYSPSLARWCKTQRTAYRFEKSRSTRSLKKFSARISRVHITKLENIGFVWDSPSVHRWNRNCDKLKAYSLEAGCFVNDGGTKMKMQIQTKCHGLHVAEINKTYGEKFVRWCATQRSAYRNEKALRKHGVKTKTIRISETQIKKLESMGFKWDLKSSKVSKKRQLTHLRYIQDNVIVAYEESSPKKR